MNGQNGFGSKFNFLIIVSLILFLSSSVFAVSPTIWEVYPSDSGFVFGTNNNCVATPQTSGISSTCPPEMGWEGNTIYYVFTFPQGTVLPSTVDLVFNVANINFGNTPNVLLQISAGTNKSNLTVIKQSLAIDKTGDFTVSINSNLFQTTGSTGYNYIKFYGTNISPTGYGQNPPNFRMNSISLLTPNTTGIPPVLSDLELLDSTEAQGAKYFYEKALSNGFVRDTASTPFSSIAATGFGLAIFTIMSERYGTSLEWVYTPAQLRARTNLILDNILNIQSNQLAAPSSYGTHGMLFHFIKGNNTVQDSGVEVSTIDSAILFAGVVTAGEYFGGEVKTKADKIMSNVDWDFFLVDVNLPLEYGQYLEGHQFSMGWKPATGLLPYNWGMVSDESILVPVMALVSEPDNVEFISAYTSWNIQNAKLKNYAGYDVIPSPAGSLFTYTFGHAFIDFQKIGKGDTYESPIGEGVTQLIDGADWWQNSINAAKANREFCINNSSTYSSYGSDSWGLSAVQKPNGEYYGNYGALPNNSGMADHDGTIAPYSSISTIAFFKDEDNSNLMNNLGFRVLRNIYDNYYYNLWGIYGPKDSYNNKNEFSGTYLGIDQGSMVVLMENYRTGLIWNNFLKSSSVKKALGKLFTCPNGVCGNNTSYVCTTDLDCGPVVHSDVNMCIMYTDTSPAKMSDWVIHESYAPMCTNPATEEASCGDISAIIEEKVEYCQNGCENGKCIVAQITCSNNSQCNDNNPQTTDTCINAGTASSYCNSVPIPSTVLWTVTPSSYYELFNSATCDVAKQTICPGEMGWEGNTVTYKFTLPSTGLSFDNLILRYNVINLNYRNTPNVLLKISVGRTTTSMSVAHQSFELTKGGVVDISIPITYFTKGTTNYIKVNGTNITPTGYGRNPPNFKISSVALVGGNPSQPSICSTNAECNDNVSNTIDTCVNPGTSNSYCTHVVSSIACSSSAQCGVNAWLGQTTCNGNNVGDYFRTFSCINPGKTTSYCKTTDVLKTKTTCKTGTLCQGGVCVKVPCSSNSQCNDSDAYTYDVCVNPRKLDSSCTHTPIACLKNIDCDDSNPLTMDVCKYPKTIKSNCQYTPIACADNSACDDGNPLTVDKCVNPNKTSSKCTHVGINCRVDSDCDDSNPSTSDVCLYPNTTKSVCKFYPPIAKTIWSRKPTSGASYFGAATCNVLTGRTCPNEMGWEGNKVTYSFTLPQGQLTDNLELKFNVIFKNYGVSNNVLLRVSAGKSTSALKVINPSLEIDSLGEFTVSIPKSYFAQGKTNYIQLYGTNISPIGYGKNPANFMINSVSLNQTE